MENSGAVVLQIVEGIKALDAAEDRHKAEVIEWIVSGAPLFRIAKPADPPKHLVSYFVVVDIACKSLLLVDHRNAKKWLPTGGHVESDEHPRTTVEREMMEELGLPARFTKKIGDKPLFLTSTTTVGQTAGHIDVSFWYVVEGSITDDIVFNDNEFTRVAWFSFEDLLQMDPMMLDPHMHRFVRKLRSTLQD